MTTKFEGPEKKLEIILFAPQAGLRSNRDGQWDRVAKASRAAIISGIATDDLDAYLLSESSLFVWEDRILMITCGKTTLINAVPEILKIVNRDRIAFVFYERKSFMFPSPGKVTGWVRPIMTISTFFIHRKQTTHYRGMRLFNC